MFQIATESLRCIERNTGPDRPTKASYLIKSHPVVRPIAIKLLRATFIVFDKYQSELVALSFCLFYLTPVVRFSMG